MVLKMATDFPTKGEDKKVSLRNSNYPQFDYAFASGVKENNNKVWRAGGNIRGNEAFEFWTKARDGQETEGTLKWIKEREAWAARHFGDGGQFKEGKEPNLSSIAGVVAQMKWGVIGTLGEQRMKDVMLEVIKKLEGKKDDERAYRAISDLSDTVQEALRNKVDEHNEEYGDTPSKRATLGMLAECMLRGIGAFKTNPASVRPNVSSPEQWGYARVNSLLFALRTGRFQGGKHDTDLLPAGHPLSSKEKERIIEQISLAEGAEIMTDLKETSEEIIETNDTEERHIVSVEETDETVTVVFEKHGDEEMPRGDDYKEDEEEVAGEDMERMLGNDAQTRSIAITEKAIDEDTRRVRIAVSSEEPVRRSFGDEILDHSAESVDLSFLNSGRAPLLDGHNPDRQIGVVENVSLDTDRRLRAVVRFSRNGLGKEVFEDVVDGIKANISVGYEVNRMVREGEDKYRVMSWSPREVSVVSIPADVSVGLGRAKSQSETQNETVIEERNDEMSEFDIDAVKAEVREATAKEVRENTAKEVARIYDLGARHQQSELASKAVAEGKTLDQFRGELLEVIGNRPLENTDIGLNQKEARQFSLMKALRAMANPSDRQAQDEARFEFEASEAAQRATGMSARGIMLPSDVLRNWNQRDINSSDDSTLISEDYRGGDFIDVLRNASSVMQAGATMLQGLQGNVVIPKKTAGSAPAWIATEGGASSETEATFSSVVMSPKVVGGFSDLTRVLLQQTSLDVENLIRNDLAQGIATAIDLGALQGSGSSGQPTGIKNTSGINNPTDFAAANPTFAEVVAMETAVAEDNALTGSLAYILPASMYGALKTTTKDSGSGQFVVEPDGNINGYNAIVSNQVTAGDLYFGNFADLLVGMYGGLDITLDTAALATSGGLRVIALQTMDVAVRHAVSFAVNNDGA